jgi:hypothetical protein
MPFFDFVMFSEESVVKNIRMIGATLIGAAILVAAPISLNQTPDKGLSVSLNSAEAVIGRPLTPGSVAGVNRRVHRRAYRRGYYHY